MSAFHLSHRVSCLTMFAIVLAFQGTASGQESKLDRMLQRHMSLLTKATDATRQGEWAKRLAQETLPSKGELAKSGDWRFPWEFPKNFGYQCNVHLEAYLTQFRHESEGEYWRNRGSELGFVALAPETALRQIDDFIEAMNAAGAADAGLTTRKLLVLAHLWPRGVHKTYPTLAVYLDQGADIVAKVRNRAPAKQKLTEREEIELLLDVAEPLIPDLAKLTDAELRLRVLQSYTMHQRVGQMRYFRASDWTKFSALVNEANANNGRVAGRNGKLTSFEDGMLQWNVKTSAAVATARRIDPDLSAKVLAWDVAALTTVERKWRELLEPASFRLEKLKKGKSSYIVSTIATDSAIPESQRGTYHAASILNGEMIVDLEISSTLSAADARREVDAFLDILEKKLDTK